MSSLPVPDSLANALLRQICVSCDVAVTTARKSNPEVGCEVWTLTAVRGKKKWVTADDNQYRAAVTLAEMVGFEVEDG